MQGTVFTSLSAIVLSAAVVSGAGAEGYYGTGMLGINLQANASAPYGNNIAVDSDFPSAFDFDPVGVGAIGLGYRVNQKVRFEGRLAYRNSTMNDTRFGTGARAGEEYILNGSLKSLSMTLEGFYDIRNSSPVQPYLKAGLGVSRNTYSARLGGAGVAGFDVFDGTADGYYDAYTDGTSTNFAWNVGFGASYEMASGLTLFGEYQYINTGGVRTGQDAFTDGFGVDAAAHEVFFGIRADF